MGELKNNKNFVKELQDIIPTNLSHREVEKVTDSLLSHAFDHFSKYQARQLLFDALSKSSELAKDTFQNAWYYSDLNNEGYFGKR